MLGGANFSANLLDRLGLFSALTTTTAPAVDTTIATGTLVGCPSTMQRMKRTSTAFVVATAAGRPTPSQSASYFVEVHDASGDEFVTASGTQCLWSQPFQPECDYGADQLLCLAAKSQVRWFAVAIELPRLRACVLPCVRACCGVCVRVCRLAACLRTCLLAGVA